jgi:hypothetical protein
LSRDEERADRVQLVAETEDHYICYLSVPVAIDLSAKNTLKKLHASLYAATIMY